MAVERIALDSRLSVRYEVGVNDVGEPRYSTRTIARVRSNSDDEALWTVAAAVASLQTFSVAEVRRVDNSELLDVV